MKKNRVLSFLFSFLFTSSAFSFTNTDFPNVLSVKSIPECEGCEGLWEGNRQRATLLRAPNKKGTFLFLDEKKQLLFTIKARKTSYFIGEDMWLDVVDNDHNTIARLLLLRDFKFASLYGFNLYSLNADIEQRILRGRANVLGTSHSIYSNEVFSDLAELTRPLRTWSQDSELKILNPTQLFSYVDPNVFAAAVALYCNQIVIDIDDSDSMIPLKFEYLAQQLEQLSLARGLINDERISKEQMKMAGKILSQRYLEIYGDEVWLDDDGIQKFINFACGLIQSNAFTPIEEKAMIQFLLQRLTGFNLA